jgi:thymidylate kinase
MQRESVQQNFLPGFFRELNENSVRYCVLRNFQQLPESTGGSDLDILVHEQDISGFLDRLKFWIKENGLQIVSVIEDRYGPKYCIANETWAVQIDVFKGAVRVGKTELIPSGVLFAHTEEYQGVKVLDPKAGAVLSFLKELFNNGECGQKYIDELQGRFSGESIAPDLLSSFPSPFRVMLNAHLNDLSREHCRCLFGLANRKFCRSRFSGLRQKICRLFRQPGFSVAFLGTDGSGKSTLIEGVMPVLNEAFHKAVYYEHMRPNCLPSIARLFGKQENFEGPVTNPHGSSTSGVFGSLFRWAYYMLDYTIGFYLKVWPKKAIRSCAWIFDRYYYDYLIDPHRARVSLPRWLLKAGQFLIPEPDIILCLGADSAMIHQRKPELPLEEVERQVRELKSFCDSHKRAVWIDTGKSIDESSQDALKAILGMMSKRFEKVKIQGASGC